MIDLTSSANSNGVDPPRMPGRRGRNGRPAQTQTHKLFARYSAHLKTKKNMREAGVRSIIFDDEGIYFAIVCKFFISGFDGQIALTQYHYFRSGWYCTRLGQCLSHGDCEALA